MGRALPARCGTEGSAPWVGAVDERPRVVRGKDGAPRELTQEGVLSEHCGIPRGKCGVWAPGKGKVRRRWDGGSLLGVWNPRCESDREGCGMIHKERLFALSAG